MRPLLPVRPLLMTCLAAGLLAGLPACQGEPPPNLVGPITETGSPIPLVPSKVAPDAQLKQLGVLGAEAAQLLGQDLGRLAGATAGYYAAYDKFPKSGYRVAAIAGWDFRQGWYWSTDNSETFMMRVRFEADTGLGPEWDVTRDENYGPDMHPAFPGDLVRMRVEYERALPSGGRMALTLFSPVGDRQQLLEVKGSGSAFLPATLGQVGFEALNAVFKADKTLDKGDLTLKSLYDGATRQFSGQYGPQGILGRAKMYQNGSLVGETGLVDSQWQFVNEGGTYPLQ